MLGVGLNTEVQLPLQVPSVCWHKLQTDKRPGMGHDSDTPWWRVLALDGPTVLFTLMLLAFIAVPDAKLWNISRA